MGRFKLDETTASLPNSGVTAGTYTNADITVNSQGVVVFAQDGTMPATALNDLTDVTLTGPIVNQMMRYNGSQWVNITLNLDDINDVSLAGLTTGSILTYNGTNWVANSLNLTDVLETSDIGVTVQGWDADLQAYADISTNGFIVRTGPGVASARTLSEGIGIDIANPAGTMGNPIISMDILGLATAPSIDINDDYLVIHNFDLNTIQKVTILDAVLEAVPVVGGTSLGSGIPTFKQLNGSKLLEHRSIRAASSNVTVNLNSDTIEIDVNTSLSALGSLTPSLDHFIVGTGAGWSVENASTARTSLGLGTIATRPATDFLEKIGGIMTGAINMSGNFITNVLDPVNPQDAATKFYVDNQLGLSSGGIAGAGLIGNLFTGLNVGQGDGITVNANDIELNLTFTDARYHTKVELNEDNLGSEGADLIGTSVKPGLNNSNTVEEALGFLNQHIPFVTKRIRQDISSWNLDITLPSASRKIVHDVEVASFAPNVDSTIFKDILLPPDFDTTYPIVIYISVAKEQPITGVGEMALAWQHLRAPGFTADLNVAFTPGNTTAVQVIQWVIPAFTFQPLDTVTLRLKRRGTSPVDTYNEDLHFFAALMMQ